MAIIRLSDGDLLFYNAIPVSDDTLEAIGKLGRPSILVIPQHLHMIDAHAFRERLGLKVFAPKITRAQIEETVQVDGSFEDLPKDPTVSVLTVAGFRSGEGLALVRSSDRANLVVADVVLNVPHGKGLNGLVSKLLGFTGERPKLPRPVRFRVLKDGRALKAELVELANTPGLTRIVTSHGRIVANDPKGALLEIARSL